MLCYRQVISAFGIVFNSVHSATPENQPSALSNQHSAKQYLRKNRACRALPELAEARVIGSFCCRHFAISISTGLSPLSELLRWLIAEC
jgi:hypothetical protein